ncbi:hypothetical protein V7014_09485 [Bacillus sp. JJ722]
MIETLQRVMTDMENWYILVTIVLMASILQTSTGFGFSIISMPFLF